MQRRRHKASAFIFGVLCGARQHFCPGWLEVYTGHIAR